MVITDAKPRLKKAQSTKPGNSSTRPSRDLLSDSLSFDPLDVGSEIIQLFIDALVSAVDVIDSVDLGHAVRRQGCQNEGCRGTEVTRHDGSAIESLVARL